MSLLFHILYIDYALTCSWPWQPCVYVHRRCVNTVPIHTNLKYQTQTTVTSLQQLCLLSVSAYFSSFFFHFFMSSFSPAFPSKHDSVSNNLELWHQPAFVCVSCFISLHHFSTLHLQCVLQCTRCAVILAHLRPHPPWTCLCVLFTQTCTERSVLWLNSFRSRLWMLANMSEHTEMEP